MKIYIVEVALLFFRHYLLTNYFLKQNMPIKLNYTKPTQKYQEMTIIEKPTITSEKSNGLNIRYV